MTAKNLEKNYELDQLWDKVEDAWHNLKKAVVAYRKLENEYRGTERDDAWYFGYILGSAEWTSSREGLKAAFTLGIDEGITTKNMREILLAKEKKDDND